MRPCLERLSTTGRVGPMKRFVAVVASTSAGSATDWMPRPYGFSSAMRQVTSLPSVSIVAPFS